MIEKRAQRTAHRAQPSVISRQSSEFWRKAVGLRIRAVGPWELFDRCVRRGGLQEGEGGVEHLVVALSVVSCAHWPSERMLHDKCPRELHLLCTVGKCFRHDRYRRNAGIFDRSRYVSDRHVTHRSDRDEEHHIETLGADTFYPTRELPAQPAVRCGSGE